MANIQSVTNYFTKSVENFSTTIASPGVVNAGATTVPLDNTTVYSQGDWVIHIVNPSATTRGVYTGQINGSNVINVRWTEGGNGPYAAGSTVVDYVTASHWDMMSTGILKEHKQSGAHANINADSIVSTGLITGTGGLNIGGGAISLPNGSLPITTLTNPSNCSVYLSSAATAGGIVMFNNKNVDTGNNFNTSTGLFTATVAGVYAISAQVSFNLPANTGYSAYLYKNNAVRLDQFRAYANTAFEYAAPLSRRVTLAANDTVGVFTGDTNASIYATNQQTYFDIALVSTT